MSKSRAAVTAGVFVSSFLLANGVVGQVPRCIIDVHLHAYPADFWGEPGMPNPILGGASRSQTDEAIRDHTLAEMRRHGIVQAVVSGPLETVIMWKEAAPDRFIASPHFPGLVPFPALGALRTLYESGRFGAMAEVLGQYAGLSPSDPALEPYLALAEEFDVPVGFHMGISRPGISYDLAPDYRAEMGNPLLLEEMLQRHPNLRVYIMHAGYPFLEETIALMWAHPQVNAGLGVINWVVPRPAFHNYLRTLVDAGLGERLMFGSDQMIWPEAIEKAIEGIESADFLTDRQKRDIFYNNAVRFLRLESRQGC